MNRKERGQQIANNSENIERIDENHYAGIDIKGNNKWLTIIQNASKKMKKKNLS